MICIPSRRSPFILVPDCTTGLADIFSDRQIKLMSNLKHRRHYAVRSQYLNKIERTSNVDLQRLTPIFYYSHCYKRTCIPSRTAIPLPPIQLFTTFVITIDANYIYHKPLNINRKVKIFCSIDIWVIAVRLRLSIAKYEQTLSRLIHFSYKSKQPQVFLFYILFI